MCGGVLETIVMLLLYGENLQHVFKTGLFLSLLRIFSSQKCRKCWNHSPTLSCQVFTEQQQHMTSVSTLSEAGILCFFLGLFTH